MHNEWSKAAHEVYDFHQMAIEAGHTPRPPIILTNISCAETHDEATDRAVEWLGKKWDSVDNHYRFSDGGLASVKGYEAYGRIGRTYAKMADQTHRNKMTDTYVKIQIVGTPDECLQQIAQLRQYTGLDHLVCEFGYGGLPHHEAELNMRLFADRVMPVLQRDKLFTAAAGDHHRAAGAAGRGRVRSGITARSERPGQHHPVANRRHRYHPAMPDFRLERAAGGRVAGVDEVGRGPLSGPVLAAAVVFPRGVPRKLAAHAGRLRRN